MSMLLRGLWTEDKGQDIAEYAVMLAVILVLVIGTVRLVGRLREMGSSKTTARASSRRSRVTLLPRNRICSQSIFRAEPNATRVRDDWGEPAMNIRLKVDPDRANLSGITNLYIALSSPAAESGLPVSTYREADKQIPIAVRLRMGNAPDCLTFKMTTSIPCPAVSAYLLGKYQTLQPKWQYRKSSAAINSGRLRCPRFREFQKNLPAGYFLEIGGEYDEQQLKPRKPTSQNLVNFLDSRLDS